MKTVLLNMRSCYGCRACEQLCPVNAIEMEKDGEGYLFPEIDQAVCIDCGLCRVRCPANRQIKLHKPVRVFAAVNKNKEVLSSSASGGVFPALAEAVLKQGGIVVGSRLDSDFYARNKIAENAEEAAAMRGSKYVQSDTQDTYAKIKVKLAQGQSVLYTGTPCQIGGLYAFLNKDDPNLITAELICHGVPSPELFKQHIEWLQKRHRRPISSFLFRSKLDRLQSYYFCYTYADSGKKEHGSAALDPYYAAFLKAKTYRECCYQCPFAQENRGADFTIADYWNAGRFHPEFEAERHVSILTLNTEKAIRFLPALENSLRLVESTLENIKAINFNLNQPTPRPDARDLIYKYISENGYEAWANRYCSNWKWKLRYFYGKLPFSIRKIIKSITRK